MSEIKFERFDNILKFLPKSKIKAGDGQESGKYPFFTSSATLSKFIDVFDYENESLIFGSGGNASIHYCNEKFATSTDCFVVDKDSEDIDIKYVYYYLKSNIKLLIDGFKGAGLKHISKRYISEIKIPLLSLAEQQKIAQLLTQIEKLISKREESIKLLDELTKSTFLYMFGDPVVNPRNLETKTIEQLVKEERNSIKRGPFGGALKKEIFVEDGYLVYEQFHALNNDFTMARYFIDKEKFKELEGFEVKAGDIIISCSGVYLGKLAIVPPNARQGIINQALLKVSLDEKKMNNTLFTYIFTNENFKNKFFGNSRGAGIPNFPPMSDFKKFKFITPPKPQQDKFAKVITQIETTKTIYQESLDELNNLFCSIAQKAFKGELNVNTFSFYETKINKKLKKLEKTEVIKKELVIVENTEANQNTISKNTNKQVFGFWHDVGKTLLVGAGVLAPAYVVGKIIGSLSTQRTKEEQNKIFEVSFKEEEEQLIVSFRDELTQKNLEEVYKKYAKPRTSKMEETDFLDYQMDLGAFNLFLKEALIYDLDFNDIFIFMRTKEWAIPYDEKFNKKDKLFTYKETIFNLLKEREIFQRIEEYREDGKLKRKIVLGIVK